MKKLYAFLAVCISTFMLLLTPCIFAVTPENAASALHELGLLAGVGTKADGSINFDEGGSLTRAQSITQVVRFLGKETGYLNYFVPTPDNQTAWTPALEE